MSELKCRVFRKHQHPSCVGSAVVCLALLWAGPSFSRTLVFGESNPQFGTVTIGEKSEPKIISITNVSNTPILLTHVRMTQGFTQANECPIWLPEGDGCRIYVTFTPNKAGRVIGTMYVDWTGKGEQRISLTGFGVARGETGTSVPTQSVGTASRSINDEERAEKLIRDRMRYSTPESTKRYIYSSFMSKDPEVIDTDEKIFALTKDSVWKGRTAAILVRLGVEDATYLNYLTKQAEKSLEHDRDVPTVYSYDQNRMPTDENPALVRWCAKNQMDTEDAYEITYFEIGRPWSDLAAAQYPGNYNLLVGGLHSRNIVIPEIAAGGLALLHDDRAIPELISAGRRVPIDGLGGIVEALLCFPNPKAQAAAWEIIPDPEKEKEKERAWFDALRKLIKKDGPHAFFGWG